MALTKDDLQAVRSVVREETRSFVTKDDLAQTESLLRTASRADLLETARKLEAKLAGKEDLLETEGRLAKKIEFETEKLARMVAKESVRLGKRDEELSRHVGYAFEPESEDE